MIVELYEEGGMWWFKDAQGIPFNTGMSTSIIPKEVKTSGDNIKKIIKLKEAGFTAEDIIDMKKGDVL